VRAHPAVRRAAEAPRRVRAAWFRGPRLPLQSVRRPGAGQQRRRKKFCTTNYGVTFPLFSKIEVNGQGRAPLYSWLTGQSTKPDGPGDVKWNFAKFVIDRTGAVVARFDPSTTPAAPEVRAVIQKALDS